VADIPSEDRMSEQHADSGKPAAGTPRGRGMWACSLVAIVMILVLGALAYVTLRYVLGWPTSVGTGVKNFVTDVTRPKVDIHEIILTTVQKVQHENKLVVLTSTLDVDVTRKEGSSSWGVYWGTNVARVMVRDAKVQYCIDLGTVGTADLGFDESRRVLTINVPRPHLDEGMVSIDPAKIETVDLSGGWARWDKRDTWDRAVAELMPKVLRQAKADPLLAKEADEAGKEAVTAFLKPVADTLHGEDVTLEVRYRN
jgi:hypothetical protein